MLSAFDGVNHRRAPTHTTAGDYGSILPKISVVCLLAERPIIFFRGADNAPNRAASCWIGQLVIRADQHAERMASPGPSRKSRRTIILIGAKQRRRVTDPHWWRKRTAEAKMKRILLWEIA
jgi:hypothetical protein